MEDHLPASFRRQKLPAALRRFDRQFCSLLFTVPGKSYRRLNKLPFFVFFRFIIVFIEYKASVCSRIYMETHFFRICLDTVHFLCHGDQRPCFCQHRERGDAPVQVQHSSAPVSHAGKHVIPGSFWKPGSYLSHVEPADLGSRNRRAQKLAAEEILIWHFIGFLLLRIVIIHRQHQGQILLISPVVHGIQVRYQPVPQPEKIFHHICNVLPVSPGLLGVKLAVAGMKAHNRGEYAELEPTARHLVVLDPHHMTADIMTPHTVSDIRGRGCEIRLESKRSPGHDSIPGKTDGIPVASRSCISGKGHGPFPVPSAVQIVIMVQHPERIQPLHLTDPSGLPVQPPEIHALLFHRPVDVLKAGFQEFWVRRVKIYRLFIFPVCAHFFSYRPVRFLMGPDTVRRMDVQRHPHIPVMEPLKKLLRIRKQIPVPGVTGPAAAVLWINVYQMPVHINDSHGKRDLFLFKTLHQSFIGRLCIFVIPAPPVAQGISGNHRDFPGKMIKVL